MRLKTLFITLAVAAILVFATVIWRLGSFGDNGLDSTHYKIGVIGPFSGESAALGDSIKKGIDLAVKHHALGNIEVVYRDTLCDPAEAVLGINELISVNHVNAIIGEACSGATLAAAPVAQQNRIPMISPGSTSPEITKAGDFIFRTVPSDALQGEFAAKMIYDDNQRDIGVVYSNEPYGIGFIEIFTRSFHNQGGNIVVAESFDATFIESAKTAFQSILSKDVDAIFMVSNGPETMAEIIKYLDKHPDAPPLYGAEGIYFAAQIEGMTTASEGLVVSLVSLGNEDFKKAHQSEYGEDPGLFASQSYDAFNSLALAFEHSYNTGLSLEKSLSNIDFKGATGQIIFDSNGDVAGNYEAVQVIDGKFQTK